MDNLITKTTVLTNEEYKNMLNDILNNSLQIAYILIYLSILTIIFYIGYKKYDDIISGLMNFITAICAIIAFIAFIVVLCQYFIQSINNQPGKTMIQQPAQLIEIRDYIKIDNNRLTIKPLPENYQYKNNTIDKNKSHDFKIDDFYKESNVKLIDSNNNTYEITHEQLEKLKRS